MYLNQAGPKRLVMNTLELTCMPESDPIISRFSPEVLARDQFCEVDVQRKYSVFIMNDQEQYRSGNHWVLVAMLPHEVIFFDSFAKSPRHYAIDKDLHKKKRETIINRMVLQGPMSNVYGEFCMFLGFFLCRGYRLEDILKSFSEDLSFNEKAVYLQIQNLFSSHFIDHCNFTTRLLMLNVI